MKGKPSLLSRLTGGRFGQPPPPPEPKAGCPGGCGCAGASESDNQPVTSRRNFLAMVGVGTAGLAAALAGIPIIGALFSTPARSEQVWHAVGSVDDFDVDDTVKVEFVDDDPVPWAGPAARNAAYLRRLGDEEFTAFSVYCTHVGCPVSWRAGASLFICPCHGGVFDREGDVVAGPPETPLVRLNTRIREGRVEILAAPVPVTGRRRS
jgi:menaquinol-cytochrome c reductase iron-sulfur subunit